MMVNPVLLNPNSKLAVVLSWLPWSSPIIMPMRMGLTTVSPVDDRRLDRRRDRRLRRRGVAVGADLSRGHADVRQEAELRGSGEVDQVRVERVDRWTVDRWTGLLRRHTLDAAVGD